MPSGTIRASVSILKSSTASVPRGVEETFFAERGQFLEHRLLRYLAQRIRKTSRGVARGAPQLRRFYTRAFPLVVAGAAAARLGMWYEILRPTPGKLAILLGEPVHSAGDGLLPHRR